MSLRASASGGWRLFANYVRLEVWCMSEYVLLEI